MSADDRPIIAPVAVSQATCEAAYGVSPRWYLCRALETEPRNKIRRPTRMVNACWSVVAAEMRVRTKPVNSALQVFANLLALNIKTRTVLAVALAAVEGEIAEAKP